MGSQITGSLSAHAHAAATTHESAQGAVLLQPPLVTKVSHVGPSALPVAAGFGTGCIASAGAATLATDAGVVYSLGLKHVPRHVDACCAHVQAWRPATIVLTMRV